MREIKEGRKEIESKGAERGGRVGLQIKEEEKGKRTKREGRERRKRRERKKKKETK